MKKNIILLLLFAFITSCNNEVEDSFQRDSAFTPKPRSSIRSYSEALQIAQASIGFIDGQTQTRSTSPRKIALSDSKICKLDIKTRTSSDNNDTLMYVFNFEDNQGFAIISACRNTEALLAVTEKGHYDPDFPTEVDGFNFYMKKAKEYLRLKMRKPEYPLYLDSIVIRPDTSLKVGPYVSVAWGQNYPEGELCPNMISGCTNTALAQIMSYFEYPDSINITYTNPFVEHLNWTQMKSHATQHPYNSCCSQITHNSISLLHRQLGHLNNSNYTYNGTGTYTTYYAKSTMEGLGYQTGEWSYYNIADAKNHLDANHLLLMRGDVNGPSGHAWLLDGYLPYREYIYRLEPMGIDMAWIVTSITAGSIVYYSCHMNWGWYGLLNGFYSTSVFNFNSPEFGNSTQITDVVYLPIYLNLN